MTRALVVIISLLGATACFSGLSFASRSDSFLVDGSPASEAGWVHVRVAGRGDTCLDLPRGSMKELGYGRLDQFWISRRRKSFSYYLRPVAMYDGPVAAVSLSFIWVDGSVGPFSESEIAQLGQTLTSAEQTKALVVQRIFDARADFRAVYSYETEDLGATEISGYLARRIEWWDVRVRETPPSNEFYLVSLSPAEALIIELEFDSRATHADRNIVLPKVIQSIVIRDARRTGP